MPEVSLAGYEHGSWNSFVYDFICRQKTAGNHITDYIVRQLPAQPPSTYLNDCKWIGGVLPVQWIYSRVLELSYSSWDLEPFAKECGYDGPPFKWDKKRRFLIRCELDAIYFHLYGIDRDDVDYIMETFPIVKRKDDQKYGEYRTKLVILECYDAMAEAMKTGRPYQTILDPPPADPRVAHPPKEA